VSDIAGSAPRAQEKIGLVMVSRRKLMADLMQRRGYGHFSGNWPAEVNTSRAK
jgi:hypothetical protein